MPMRLNMPFRLRAIVLAVAVFALAGCQQQASTNPETQAGASTAPDAKPGVSVAGGTLVLPTVSGNPGVAYFALSNAGEAPATLAAVHVAGAENAELHETKDGTMGKLEGLEIHPGETVTFERGGKHVMVFGLDSSVAEGGTTEMTLTFADGDKLSTPLAIQSAASAMAGMDHGEAH